MPRTSRRRRSASERRLLAQTIRWNQTRLVALVIAGFAWGR